MKANLTLPGDPVAAARYQAEITAGEACGHILTATKSGIIDTITCSCGWESEPYYDGLDLAYTAWVAHIIAHDVVVPTATPA